jgi:hypothetical protein
VFAFGGGKVKKKERGFKLWTRRFRLFELDYGSAFDVPDGEDWQDGPCIEVLFEIVEGTDTFYEFDFAHMRTTQDLLLGAILLSDWKKQNVVFLTATACYSAMAVRFTQRYQRAGFAACPTLTIGVAGNLPEASLREADVIFHHGRDYPLPQGIKPKRRIIQRFPGENVPHDTRSLSALVHAAGFDNDDYKRVRK